MTTLAWVWFALLGAVFVGGIVLYVFVIRPVMGDDENNNVYGRFE